MIILHPEKGDRVSDYQTVPCRNPLTGKPGHMLDHKPNGECIYLGSSGCTIHGRAPLICREFDCRKMYLKFSRAERKRLVRDGLCDQSKFDAGRDRIGTLAGAA